ncbi:hypothetical protein B0H11DRAFT_498751 [Mycena galericulata]|nr:hypothetical protein B0H11DRAFT_498751 [Mycena galericulata]
MPRSAILHTGSRTRIRRACCGLQSRSDQANITTRRTSRTGPVLSGERHAGAHPAPLLRHSTRGSSPKEERVLTDGAEFPGRWIGVICCSPITPYALHSSCGAFALASFHAGVRFLSARPSPSTPGPALHTLLPAYEVSAAFAIRARSRRSSRTPLPSIPLPAIPCPTNSYSRAAAAVGHTRASRIETCRDGTVHFHL